MPPEDTALSEDLLEPTLDTDQLLRELHELTGIVDPEAETAPDPEAEGTEAGDGIEGSDPSAETGETGDAEAGLALSVSPVPPGMIEFDGRMIEISEARALIALGDRLRAEPDTARRVAAAINPDLAPATAPEEPEFDDPATQRIYEELREVKVNQARYQARMEAETERNRQATVVDAWRASATEFRRAYPGIDDEQMANIVNTAGSLKVFDALAQSLGSPAEGFRQGLEMVLWSRPEFRALAGAEGAGTVPSKKQRSEMKQAASALAGSSGSAPRTKTETRPTDRQGVLAALLDTVRDEGIV